MIVLASKSASRRAMLEAAGVVHEARPADIDERAVERTLSEAGPAEIAEALARAKAQALEGTGGTFVLGSDSLVTVEGRRFDKPATLQAAREHLRFFSGKVMELHSGAALARDGKICWSHSETARLHVRPLSEDFIESYLAAEWPDVAHCVGVFRFEGLGAHLFERVEGSHFTILGMPLLAVLAALRDLGEMPS